MTEMTFDVLHQTATGHTPYDYQRRMADRGQPELLCVPTGAGKTAAAVLPWIYRRRFHPDPKIRATTPRRLVFTLPMRVLVEQTASEVSRWFARLGLSADVHLEVVMGGEPRRNDWRTYPEADVVIIGTLDMILSRALNRGYGDSRYLWPIDFGLFSNDCHYVFDEVQLMGPALRTSRQLEGIRRRLGEAIPCSSMWMSATVDERRLLTYDNGSVDSRVELTAADRSGPLRSRLEATKKIREVIVEPGRYGQELAQEVVAVHRPGTLTLVVLNTVDRAGDVSRAIAKLGVPAERVLLHSRFRPPDRSRAADAALAPVDPTGDGRIVVSTQVIEAGVDISATMMITEAAPWPSIVQRAGRCNRDGLAEEAILMWIRPPRPEPYEASDVEAASVELTGLEGDSVSPESISDRSVSTTTPIYEDLRFGVFVDLFGTHADVSGNDIDVGRFLRDAADLDVAVAWRDLPADGPPTDAPTPTRNERCPVPLTGMRKWMNDDRRVWRFDSLGHGWQRVYPSDLRPGDVLVVRSQSGGYSPERGFDPRERSAVAPAEDAEAEPLLEERSTDDDPFSYGSATWLPLRDHLADVQVETEALLDTLRPAGLSGDQCESAVRAARLHDIGKAHPVFQTMLRATAVGREIDELPPPEVMLAKSAGSGRAPPQRRGFRHELASALALLDAGATMLDDLVEPDLAIYLVGAHHGRVRLRFRPWPHEIGAEGPARAMGVIDGEPLPSVEVPGGVVPAGALHLDSMALGSYEGVPSWAARMVALRDRADLGPIRMAFLEAMVRLADWRASAAPGAGSGDGDG